MSEFFKDLKNKVSRVQVFPKLHEKPCDGYCKSVPVTLYLIKLIDVRKNTNDSSINGESLNLFKTLTARVFKLDRCS